MMSSLKLPHQFTSPPGLPSNGDMRAIWQRIGMATRLPTSSPSLAQMERSTRPCSASLSPYPVLEGSGGLNTFEAAFAFRLECALWGVLLKDEKNAKAGIGRETLMKWRSEQELEWDAWASLTGWGDDPYSPGHSTDASSPDESVATATTQLSVGITDTHDPSPPSENSISLPADDEKTASLSCGGDLRVSKLPPGPSKRKMEDEEVDGRIRKRRIRTLPGIAYRPEVPIDKFTPPSTPPSCNISPTKAAVHGNKNPARPIKHAAQKHYLKREGCNKSHAQTLTGATRSTREYGLQV